MTNVSEQNQCSMQQKYSIYFPSLKIEGCVHIPASKSISNRLLILNYLSGGKTKIENLSNSDDTRLLQNFCKEIEQIADGEVIDFHSFDCKNAGTVFRFLTPVLANTKGNWLITGSERMQKRPIAPLVDALRTMGANITYLRKEGFPPLKIQGVDLTTSNVKMEASVSSQFVSALMMLAAASLPKPFEINLSKAKKVSLPYISMTAALLQEYGLHVDVSETCIRIEGECKPLSSYFVEADWSSASYLYALLALAEEGSLFLPHYFQNSLQGDAIIADLFIPFGINTQFESKGIRLTRQAVVLPAEFSFDFTNYPDLTQTMAVLCAGMGIKGRFYGLSALKYKEADRITALYNELLKLGVICETNGVDELRISSGIKNTDVCIDTYQDHRMAMAFSVLAMRYGGIKIENPQVVEKSFTNYWHCMEQLGMIRK